jgi:DNA invertase Pin-like site-specific DNA recombinase
MTMTQADQTLHIYIRVSTVAQAEHGTSLESQRDLGIKKAQELGFCHRVWDEGGKSSHHEDIADRPILSELFTALKEGAVKHLWVYDQSRLSRNDHVASVFRYQCNKQGVTLYTKDGVYDLSNPNDRLTRQLLDAIAEFENATRAERTRIGKLNKVRKGSWHGGPAPYGYELEDHKLVVNQEEAKWVRRIFAEFIKGSSTAQIKQLLDSNGVEPRRKKGLWTLGSINALVRNTHYSGYYIFKDKKSEEPIQVQCPSIVDLTTWNATQHKRSSEVLRQSQKNATVKHFYLLRDFMYCAHCGRPLAGRIIKERAEASYYCPNKERAWAKDGGSKTPWRRGMGCGFIRSMNIKQADELVWNTIKSLHQNSSILKEEAKHRLLKEGGVVLVGDADIKAINTKIKRYQKDHQRLSDSLGALEANRLINGLNDVAFASAASRIKDEIGKVETELASLRLELAGAARSRKWVDWLKAFGDEVSGLDSLSDQKKKEYLGGLIKRIDVKYEAEQRQHILLMTLHLPIVNDGIKYKGKGERLREYDVIDGADKVELVAKKKDGRG